MAKQIPRYVVAAAAVFLIVAGGRASATPVTYDGITFPGGDASFADQVVLFLPGDGVAGDYDDPLDALGPPDYSGSTGAVSLGNFGTLILRFTDNALTTSGNSNLDLHIFEVGNVVETFNLSISVDNINWIDLGNLSGQPTSVDIDGFAGVVAGAEYTYVRLIDVAPDQTGSPFSEADIDAVGAISSVPRSVPEPGTLALLMVGLLSSRALKPRSHSAAAPGTSELNCE